MPGSASSPRSASARSRRLHQRRAGGLGRHPLDHRHAGHRLRLARHGGVPRRRQAVRAARFQPDRRSGRSPPAACSPACSAATWCCASPTASRSRRWSCSALAVLLWFILNRHRFGEALLFIGDNANVARVVGIDVKATRLKLFTLMGALAGLAGMFLTMETENFTTTQGQGLAAGRHRRRLHRRHLDLRRLRHHRRQLYRPAHRRHAADRHGGAWASAATSRTW